MAGWTLGNVTREAYKNATAAAIRSIAIGVVFGGLSFSVVWLEMSVIGEAEALERRYAAAGGYIAVVSSDVGLDAAACHHLGDHPAIDASGGYRSAATVNLATSPRIAFQHLAATPGLVRVWDPASGVVPKGYVVGRAAADELGLDDGSWIAGPRLAAGMVTIFDPELRNPFASRTIVELVPPTGTIDECWVQLSASTFEPGIDMLAATFPEAEPTVRHAIERGDLAQDPDSLRTSRMSQWAWIPASLVAAAVMTLTSLFRRPEIALYRAFGLQRTGVLLMLQVETLLTATMSVIAGASWAAAAYALTIGAGSVAQLATAARTDLFFLFSVVVVGPIAASLAAAGSPASLLKER